MKQSKILYLITLLAGLLGCKTNDTLTIEPIDKEFNEQLLTGERLNDQLFSTKEKLQYYQIDNFKHLKSNELLSKLHMYVAQNYKAPRIDFETLTVFFYKKDNFANYSDLLYEAAQDPIGSIDAYKHNLVVKTILTKQKDVDQIIHKSIFYDKGQLIHTQSDTISTK